MIVGSKCDVVFFIICVEASCDCGWQVRNSYNMCRGFLIVTVGNKCEHIMIFLICPDRAGRTSTN